MKRFWDKVNKTETCWNWTASSRGVGYGAFKYEGLVYDSHRFVWFLTYGSFPKLLVLHKCDNRRCVNPEHLYEGTFKQNVRDMVDRGRNFIPKNLTVKDMGKHGLQMYTKYKCRCEVCYKAKQVENSRRVRGHDVKVA